MGEPHIKQKLFAIRKYRMPKDSTTNGNRNKTKGSTPPKLKEFAI